MFGDKTGNSSNNLADIFINTLASNLSEDPASSWPDRYYNRETKKFYSPHNEDEEFFVYSDTPKYMLCKGGEGDLSLDTKVVTDNGNIEIEHIRIGDILFDDQGNMCEVIKLSQIYNRDCYKIIFDTGDSVIASSEHYWYVETEKLRQKMHNYNYFHIDLTEKDDLPGSKLKTKDLFYSVNNGERYSIPINNQISTYKKDYNILLEYSSSVDDIINNEYIPRLYFNTSSMDRYLLITNILRKYKKINNIYVVQSKNLGYIHQIRELLSSIAIKTNIPENINDCYTISIKENLVNSKEKRNSFNSNRLYIDSIVKIDSVPTKCITVNSPNNIFLVYSNGLYIPTCNSGKSVAGIIKTLNKLKRGMSGVMLSPDVPHFKKSLWPEFVRWCPESVVIPKHRYRLQPDYTLGADRLIFKSQYGTYVTLYLGGIDKPRSWEGPNLNFVHFDEAQRKKDSLALEVLSGRVRQPGPMKEPAQLYLTSVPMKNWMFEFFGPIKENDPKKSFKEKSHVVTLKTSDNIENLDSSYIEDRSATLTEAERSRRIDAEWVDSKDIERFIPDMVFWDRLKKEIPPLTKKDTLILALDGATTSDNFAIVGVTRDSEDSETSILVRLVKKWTAKNGYIDFQGTEEDPGPELYIREICKQYNVIAIAYDPRELHDMVTRLTKEHVAWFRKFNQNQKRIESDSMLLDLIVQQRIHHDGNFDLRDQINNSNKQKDKDDKSIRIVKRNDSLKIDLTVALAMACHECMYLNI